MIYMDNAAITKPLPEVVAAVLNCMMEDWYNPSSAYSDGRRVKAIIEEARRNVAALIGAEPEEIHFTSGATESANILVNSLYYDTDIYISDGEHPAVDSAVENIEHGVVPIDKYGTIKYRMLPTEGYDYDKAVLFAIGANNEVGTITPLKELGEFCLSHGILLAVDLTQAAGHIPINVKDWHVGFAFGSGQKFGGLSGCGFLYVDKRYESLIEPMCKGGGQDAFKGGTENITGIVAIGEAAKVAKESMSTYSSHLKDIRDYMIDRILNEIPDTVLIGHPTDRLPNNVNIGFGGMDSESIVQYLDLYGVCASAGSACHTKSVEPSHVLKAMRVPDKYIDGCVRFTLSVENTKQEIDEVVEILKNARKSEMEDT